ncbi:hypothetical protein [Arthrobacter sp. UYEF36]|uniref:hypothetical protein n=1 Tax=Arthrobacter sp. UYEF36 TaxID=1756366 RepID=UPI00339920C3
MTRQRAPFRLLRTAVVAAAVISLAAGAHVLAGGQLPPATLMAALTALTALGVVLVTKWEMTALSLAAILAAGQAVLHEAFSTLSGPAGPTSNAPLLHVHETVVRAPAASAGSELHRHLPADLDSPMLTLHVIATLATAVLLARGEAALWALAAWLRPLAGISVVRMLFLPSQPLPAPRTVTLRRWRVLRRPPLRGPPAAACP